ncbi:MAG TPA: hypothetical protein VGL35_12065 [Rhizomicrobium sp.]|jgi:hypothetical protein
MGTAPTPILVSATGTGNAADGTITRDAIDDLIGAMSPHLLIYLRAKKITPSNSSFVDALGNTVAANTSGATKNNADPNFNGKPSITFNNTNNVYTMAAGSIGVGSPPVAMTNSFTVMAGIRPSAAGAQSLYGDNAVTTGLSNITGLYLDTNGRLNYAIGSSTYTILSTLLSPAATGVIWISFDATTSILRAGLNNGSTLIQTTTNNTRVGGGTSTVCQPFGLSPSGSAGYQCFNRWALFSKAYMNGSASSDDATFTNLVTTFAVLI